MSLLRSALFFVLGSLVVFVIVLLAAQAVQSYARVAEDFDVIRATSERATKQFEQERRELALRAKEWERKPPAISTRLAEIDRALSKPVEVHDLWNWTPTGPSLNAAALEKRGTAEAHVFLLKKERDILEAIQSRVNAEETLDARWRSYVIAWQQREANASKQRAIVEKYPRLHRVPLSEPYNDLQRLSAQFPPLDQELAQSKRAYEDQADIVQRLHPLTALLDQKMPETVFAQARATAEAAQQENIVGRVLQKLLDSAAALLRQALIFVILGLGVAIAVRAIFYYVLAPLVTRRPGVAFLAGPTESRPTAISHRNVNRGVSLSLPIDKSNEFVVHADYLQSTPDDATKDTKWFLSSSYWFSSFASDLCFMTRLRSEESRSVVVSSKNDPLSELASILVPAGAAVTVRPRHLVGVVQSPDRPIRISSKWRFFNLQAWLTWQWRYLVFHGPITLVVAGCRGVGVEEAGSGRTINRNATIGFSANVRYSSQRSETFFPYLMGRQPLLHDRFEGPEGIYLYQEVARASGRPGSNGRGLEGWTEAALDVFGI